MTIALICSVSFIAALIRSTLGFGESLVAVPLFLLFLPVEIAVPLSVLASVVIALIILVQDHSRVEFKSATGLIGYAILGIPLGLLLLIYGNENLIKFGLGVLISSYALYALFHRQQFHSPLPPKLILAICGFTSGIFGGAYGLNGPPLVIYGHYKKWSPKKFRATLQAYFLPASGLAVIAYALKGLLTSQVLLYFLWSLIATVPAVFIGRHLNHSLKGTQFYRYVYWGLLGLGLLLIGTVLL